MSDVRKRLHPSAVPMMPLKRRSTSSAAVLGNTASREAGHSASGGTADREVVATINNLVQDGEIKLLTVLRVTAWSILQYR